MEPLPALGDSCLHQENMEFDFNSSIVPSADVPSPVIVSVVTVLLVIVPDAVRFVKPLILLLFIARLATTDNDAAFNVIFASPDPPTCQAKLEASLLYIILPRKPSQAVGVVKSIY